MRLLMAGIFFGIMGFIIPHSPDFDKIHQLDVSSILSIISLIFFCISMIFKFED